MTFKEWWEENQYKEFYRFVSSTTAREIWQAGQNNCRKKMTFDDWLLVATGRDRHYHKLYGFQGSLEFLEECWQAAQQNS